MFEFIHLDQKEFVCVKCSGIIELRAGLIDKAELDCTRAREAAKSLKDEEARREATECINQIKSATG